MKIAKVCVVTGGAGFIGSHLCYSLINKGYFVYCLDNLLTGNSDNLNPVKNNPNFQFLNFDISNSVIKLFAKKIDYIYHLASPASPPQYRRYAIETLRVNSQGTFHMLELAKNNNSRFLLASTSEVYGDPKVHPQKESYYGNVNPVGIRACYDESKRFAESLTMEFFRIRKLDVRIIRIFNTYGPNMQRDDGRVISNFINQAISKKPLTVYGKGNQTRSFCFVSDLVTGLIKAAEASGLAGEIINLGNPYEISISKIARLVLELTGSDSKIINVDKRLGDDPQKRKPDIGKAVRLLNFSPEIDLKLGLTKTIAYFRSL